MQQAVCVRRKKNRKKTRISSRTRSTQRNPPQPVDRDHLETACDETRPERSLMPASIDTGFVEIGLVQLSQTVKTTNVTHALTDTQTDRRTDGQTDYLNDDTPAVVHGECGWIGGW